MSKSISKERKLLISNAALAVVVMSIQDGTLNVQSEDVVITSLDGIHRMLRVALESYHKNLSNIPDENMVDAVNEMGFVAGELAGVSRDEAIQSARDKASRASTEG
jgi:hypothetical protein